MSQDVSLTLDYAALGLSQSEYETIVRELGRSPTQTELGMFSVLWSEHCSYKSSREILALFSEYKKSAESSALENAGVLDIGQGVGVVFKMESHNHPSAVEPYEGAATGVGGIIRDILTMGARPIALLNSLRFGDITDEGAALDRRLFDRVVQGIGGYGNCVGVPTVAGEVSFHKRYSGSPIVNAMCIGIVQLDKIATSAASGVGNPVLYLGSATGRDGIHGASFASEVLGEDNDSKRPNVQIGDPFAGKLLIEATLEALETGAIVAIQDMGAAGLTCSTCEMSAKGNVGMQIDLDKVPLRDTSMNAYEIMLSETQERMLAVVHKGRETEVIDIFNKWGLPAVMIGEVTADKLVKVIKSGNIEAEVPAKLIADGCPAVVLDAKEPENVKIARIWSQHSVRQPNDFAQCLVDLLSSPTIASKKWVYEQYDSTVQTQTALGPGSADAAVLSLREHQKGIASKIDGNGRWTFSDPYVGGQLALVEAARNVACTGAKPLAATDCLNFANPNDPEIYFQFRETVRGMAHASEALGIPILSGNVSFYNETLEGAILPTPTVGVVGLLSDASKKLSMGFPKSTGYVYLIYGYELPALQEGLGASEYLRVCHQIEDGVPHAPSLETEKSLHEFLHTCAEESLIDCAHDISEGGFCVALSEMAIYGEAGCNALIDPQEHYQKHVLGPVLEKMLSGSGSDSEGIVRSVLEFEGQRDPWEFATRTDARLFGEIAGRVLIGVSVDKIRSGVLEDLFEQVTGRSLRMHCVGTFDPSFRHVQILSPTNVLLKVSLEDLRRTASNAIPNLMKLKPV